MRHSGLSRDVNEALFARFFFEFRRETQPLIQKKRECEARQGLFPHKPKQGRETMRSRGSYVLSGLGACS
jgi:hypothetical protein